MPLWAQVQQDLEQRLRRGEFAQTFPGEMALVYEYGVSRHTIREALRRLRESGLVDSARGRPTKVVDREIAQPQGALYSLFASVEKAGRRQRSVVRVLDARADGIAATRLGLEESTPLVYLERIRLIDDEPLAMDRVWLPAQIASPLLSTDFAETSLYAELADRCGVRLTQGRERIRAVIPSDGERLLLEIPAEVAALAIDRVGVFNGQPIEWRQTVVRGDRFSLITDLTGSEPLSVSVGQGFDAGTWKRT
jgi:GntR family transcriptional regulator